MNTRDKVIALFDVDGTLTPPRQSASTEILELLQELRKKVSVGIVGGSDWKKISEQLGANAEKEYDFVFSENGVINYKNGVADPNPNNLEKFLGADRYEQLKKFLQEYIDKLDLPFKTNNFVECRTGMINASPPGRGCSIEQRKAFYEYDKVHNVRAKMVQVLKKEFEGWDLQFSIGGEISMDIFPKGWDKTYCLRFLKGFEKIYFFGDKTDEGGNDYEIYSSPETIGVAVKTPEDTMREIKELFFENA